MRTVCVIAGEASGDLHGASLIRALKSRDASLRVLAAGGARMRAEAPGHFIETAHLHATGLTEIFKLIPQYLALMKAIERAVKTQKPDRIVFIDNPGFNLRLAKRLLPLGIPMVYYVCPQVWAWNEKRVHFMKRAFRKALVVFDFELEVYRKHGMPAAWVGHPLTEQLPRLNGGPRGTSGRKTVLLLPGSRKNEVGVLLPILLEAAKKVKAARPEAVFRLLEAPTLSREYYDTLLSRSEVPIERVDGDKYEAMAAADLGIVCSGTATLECALMKMPMIVVYRVSFITFITAKIVAKVRFLGLPNLLAGKEIVPELLQYNATADKISAKAIQLLASPGPLTQMRRDLADLSDRMGRPGASDRAAQEILSLV